MRVFKIEITDTQYIVTWRHFSVISINIIMLFMLGAFLWFVAIVGALAGDLRAVLCILVVLVCGKFVLGYIAKNYFGATTLVLDENGLESTWTWLSFKREKRIALDEIRRFDKQGRSGKATRWHRWLYVICNGKNIEFLTTAGFNTGAAGELDVLCNQLNDFLDELTSIEEPEEYCS